ncbi:MAG: hypothetical protein FWD35_03870 [Oscillospiraceae bacterium]|nr:hypothetical protein [Oscillospiraceae bacterium]
MKANYDLSKAKKKPYAQRIKQYGSETTVIRGEDSNIVRKYCRTPEEVALANERRKTL